MNPEIVTGRSVRGAIKYITHDATSAANRKPTSAARVAWTHCVNLPTDDPELSGRIMQGTIYDAPALKELSGLSTRGRKLQEPAVHLILSWRHDESPLPPHMQSLLNGKPELRAGLTKYAAVDTTLSALKELGLEDHQAVLACHTDKDYLHVHAVASRVHPETGGAAKLSHSKRILNRWAEEYEVDRGQVVTPNRIARRKAIAERQKARAEGRELPPMPPKQPKRGPGRRERTDDERRAWAEMREAHKSDTDTTEEEKCAQRVEYARLLEQLNETANVTAPAVRVPAPAAVPARPRAPMPPVDLPPAVAVRVPAPAAVPARPRAPMPPVDLPPAVAVRVPAPAAVPARPRAPMPPVDLPPAVAVRVPAPAAVPARPRTPMPPVEELYSAPAVRVPAPAAVPARPRAPMPDLPGSRPSSDAPHRAAQLLAWLLDLLRRIVNRDDGGGEHERPGGARLLGGLAGGGSLPTGDGQPGGGATQPGTDPAESVSDVSAETKRLTQDFCRRHGVSEENRVGNTLLEDAGEGIGAEGSLQPDQQPGPARDPTRRR